jgi:hypothetical protein
VGQREPPERFCAALFCAARFWAADLAAGWRLADPAGCFLAAPPWVFFGASCGRVSSWGAEVWPLLEAVASDALAPAAAGPLLRSLRD